MAVTIFNDPLISFFNGYFDAQTKNSTFRTVNTDDFDVVPKASYIERQIAAKEEEKKNLERTREMTVKHYDEQIVAMEEEIKKLKKQLK